MAGVASRVAAAACRAVFTAALAALLVWVFWYGHYQWGGPACKRLRPAVPGGSPAAMVLEAACSLHLRGPLFLANLGFFWLLPAAAALACIASLTLREAELAAPAGRGAGRRQRSALRATLQRWGSALLPPRRFWLWWCEGLTVRDALAVAAWAAYNAVWYAAILDKALARYSPAAGRPTRLIAKSLASLATPSLVLLFFPVARGSVVMQVLGFNYTEGIRYHRWLGQWVLCLITLHGSLYWFSWAQDGRWLSSALREGPDTNNLMGSIGLLFALLLWATSQEPVRRRAYAAFKAAHHVGFWGFLLLGVAHHWALFWAFLPGLLLYAVDGAFRLHAALLGAGRDARGCQQQQQQQQQQLQQEGLADAAGGGCAPQLGTTTELLHADVAPGGAMCSLLLAAPGFGAPPVGVVWLNVPAISAAQWHPFDCAAVRVAPAGGGGGARTAVVTHIKAYDRWTKALVRHLAQGGPHNGLAVRAQGPYPDPYLACDKAMDALVVVAGGNGVAAALSAFQELAAAGVATRGLPALLVWTCRRGDEMAFMGPRIMAAARALGLALTVHLYVTAGEGLAADARGGKAVAASGATDKADVINARDTITAKEPVGTVTLTLAQLSSITSTASSTASSSAGGGGGSYVRGSSDSAWHHHAGEEEEEESSRATALPAYLPVEGGGDAAAALAGANSLCPVVACASFAGQLGFKAAMHVAVFGGALAGIMLARHISAVVPAARGQQPWGTRDMGLLLVGLTAGCALAAGLVTLWAGLLLRGSAASSSHAAGGSSASGVKQAGSDAAAAVAPLAPATAAARCMGVVGRLVPASKAAGAAGAQLTLLLPVAAGAGHGARGKAGEEQEEKEEGGGAVEAYPVRAGRPDTRQLLQSWLNSLAQLPAASKDDGDGGGGRGGPLLCTLYGCGPLALLHSTQAMVQDLNARQGGACGSGGRGVQLHYVRKTWSL